MKALILVSIIALSALAPQIYAESKGDSGGKGVKRVAVGVHRGTIQEMKTETVTGFDRVTGGFILTETSGNKSPNLGFRMELGYIKGTGGSTTWAGTQDTPIEFLNGYAHVNIVLYLLRGTISPWISPGVSGGQIELKHPNGSEKKFQQGWNGEVGVDLLFGPMGLRAGYGYHNVYSDKFGKMDQRRLVFDYSRGYVAIVFEAD